jgi:DNA-directed RNA polymerase subunit RPC12/RpoP
MCGERFLSAYSDKNGNPYVVCGNCRFRILAVSPRALVSLRFWGRLLENPDIFNKWLEFSKRELMPVGRLEHQPTTYRVEDVASVMKENSNDKPSGT